MIGIMSYGAYLPLYRLSRDEIARAWGGRSMGGEKAVANQDEDSLTMAVEAGLDCLSGINSKKIDGLFFSTTTAPYKEKQCAAVIAAALDLRKDIRTADFTNSLRSGTIALRSAVDSIRSGSAKSILVVGSDCRLGEPGSASEQMLGDGAAAILLGENGVCTTIEDMYSISDEFTGPWRRDEDLFVRQFDTRFDIPYGYMRSVSESVSGLMKKCGLNPKDLSKVIIYAPDPRSYAALARKLGFDPKSQLQDPLFTKVGDTGTALCLMMLVSALEGAKPGDKMILASYGDGSDALLLRTADGIEDIKGKRGIKANLQSKRMLPNYERYMEFRKLISKERFIFPSSTITYWRDRKQELNLYGAKCRSCGTIQYPKGRVCFECGKKDDFDEVKLSKRGKVFTFALDHLIGGDYVEVPVPRAVIDLDGGGRIYLQITDCDPKGVRVDMPVELTFRKIHEGAGFHNYYWKCRPLRGGV